MASFASELCSHIVVQAVGPIRAYPCFQSRQLTQTRNATDDDCGPAVKNVPVCANSTWNMYRNEQWSNNNYFCCPPGYIGVLPQRGSSGICETEGVNIPKSQLATVASQIGGASVTASGRVPTATAGSGSSVTATNGRVPGTATVTPTSVSGDGPGPGPGQETSSNPPLSTGAIAGIAVGGATVFLILFALILWLHRRSLRKRPPPAVSHKPDEPFIQEHSTTAGETETKQPGFTQPNTPSPGYGYPAPHGAAQVDAASRVEMEAPAGGWAYDAGGRQGN